MSSDQDAQNDEMLALESIFDSDEISFNKDNAEISGHFYAFVSLPGDVKIEYQCLIKDRRFSGQSGQIFVKYLPPIELSFTLPLDYPSTSPPRFTLICSWLGRKQLSKLCEKLDSLWSENKGLEILFLWLSFLKEESFSFLGLGATIDLSKQYSFNLVQLDREKRMRKAVDSLASAPSNPLEESAKCGGKKVTPQTSSHGSPLKGGGRGRGKFYHRTPRPGGDNITTGSENEQASSSSMKSYEDRDVRKKTINSKRWQNKEVKLGPKDQLDPRAVSCDTLRIPIIDHILEYNKTRCEKEFHRNIYSCRICFDDKPGSQCIQFYGCGHIFCQECVGGYFEVQIKDGCVRSLICPQDGCKSEAHQSQISSLVSPELFARYDELLLSSALDEMEDIVYCPRKTCQYPVTYERGETMARCAHCSYTFCTLCRMTYHGVDRCRVKIDSGLVAEYESASKERKEFLEKKYGRRTIQDLIESGYSEEWIRGNSKSCPHCQAAIEKSDGCNKMTCWKCNTFFCWICMTRLNPSCPYNHYNSPTSPCFNLLFHGMPDSDDDFEVDDYFPDTESDDELP